MGKYKRIDKNNDIEKIKKVFAAVFFVVPLLLLLIDGLRIEDTGNGFQKILKLMQPELIWQMLTCVATQLICYELYAIPKYKNVFWISIGILIVGIFIYGFFKNMDLEYKNLLIFIFVAFLFVWTMIVMILRFIVAIGLKQQGKIVCAENSGLSDENCCLPQDDEEEN